MRCTTLARVNEPKTLLLSETGVEHLPDGSTAVNVGPIVRALGFLTEGRGEDRGTDEAGNPLPDLMSLAFDVIEAIILGGRKADYFRQVKRDLEAQAGASRSSLSLAKQARRVHAPAPATALDEAADRLQSLLAELASLPLGPDAAQELKQALEAFRAFGVDRWVSASAQLLVALSNLTPRLGVAPLPGSASDVTPRAKAARPRAKRTARPKLEKKPKRQPAAASKKPAPATRPPKKARPRKAARRRR